MTDARRLLFDRDPAGYASARPGYPGRVYEILIGCGLRTGARVLEIGAGTGQATAELLRRGAEVVAVEPGPALAASLRERFAGQRLHVVESDFEHADLSGDRYDLVVAATSFHWVAPEVALPKLATLLGPERWFVAWWTVFGDPHRPTPFRVALDEVLRRHRLDDERSYPGPLGVVSWSAELRQGGWFGDVTAELIPWTHRLTPQTARGLWSTFSSVIRLPPAARSAFLDDLAATVAGVGGTVDDPYVTAVYRTRPAHGQSVADLVTRREEARDLGGVELAHGEEEPGHDRGAE